MATSSSSESDSSDEDSTFLGGGTTFFSGFDFLDTGAAMASSKALFPARDKAARSEILRLNKYLGHRQSEVEIIEDRLSSTRAFSLRT